MPVRVSIFAFSTRFASKVKLRPLLIKSSPFICYIKIKNIKKKKKKKKKISTWRSKKKTFFFVFFLRNTRSITDNLS